MTFILKVYRCLHGIMSRYYSSKTATFLLLWLPLLLAAASIAAQCNTPAPALPATPDQPLLRVALLTPTGGELATVGRTMRNGIIMAFDEWNSRGGILQHRIEGVNYHTDCTVETAQQAVQQAISDGLKFIIGPLCSEAAIAAAAETESAGVLLMAPAATHPLVTVNPEGVTRPTVFMVGYSYQGQGQAAAHFARNTLGINNASLLFEPHNNYSTSLSNAFAQTFRAEGGQITHKATYIPGHTDVVEILQALEQTKTQLIYLPAQASIANQVAHHLNEAELPSKTGVILLGSDAWDRENLDLSATEGSYFPTHFSQQNRQAQSWAQRYKSIYAVAPDTLAALSYDAANILAGGIEQANTFTPEAVAKKLEQGQFEAITGPIRFNAHHYPIKPVPFLGVEDNNTRFVTAVQPQFIPND